MGYKSFGEARMIGLFGKSGSGKSFLASYLVVGFAKNEDMGILILDPQGEFINNFSASSTPLPFIEMLQLTVKPIHKIGINELKLRGNDEEITRYTLGQLIQKLIEERGIISTTYDKLKQISRYTAEGLNYDINKRYVIGDNDNEIIENFRDALFQAITNTFSRQTATDHINNIRNRGLAAIHNDLIRICELFDRDNGMNLDNLVSELIDNHAIIIVDLSQFTSRISIIDETELKAIIIYNLVERLRNKSEDLFYKHSALANILVVMDEAHRYVPQETLSYYTELERLRKNIRRGVRETRKYGIGWMFITQSTVDFDKEIYRQLHDYFFLYGLGIGADLTHMQEIVPKEFIEYYKTLPNPKQTSIYWVMHVGSFNLINTATSATFVKLAEPDEFLQLNFNISLKDLQEKIKHIEEEAGRDIG